MKKRLLLSVYIVLFALLGFACGGRDNLITSQGVGDFRFDAENPEMGRGYTTVTEEDDFLGMDVITVIDADDNDAVVYYTGLGLMYVYSPKFETMEGLKVGVTLEEALNVVDKNGIEARFDELTGVFEFWYSPEFAFQIGVEWLKGGIGAFVEDYWYGKEIALKDLESEARIMAVVVSKSE